MLKKLLQVVSATTLCFGLMSSAEAISYNQISQIYFFGDSLTDSGFNDLWGPPAEPVLPAGKAPTFTTFGGYTWSQYVARDVKGFTLPIYPGPSPADTITNNSIETVPYFVSGTLTGINYAAAGSTTNSTGNGEVWAPSLVQQVDYYLATHEGQADPNAVYFIWEGANDLLTLLTQSPPPTELQFLMTANTAAMNVANEVALLSSKGAKRFVVMSLPNIGTTPIIAGAAIETGNPALPGLIQTVSFTFNSMLNTQLGKVIQQTGAKVLYVDTYTLLDNIIAATIAGKPYTVGNQSYLYVNYTTPACGDVYPAIYCTSAAPNNYVFADTLHPTDMDHRLFSLVVEGLIQGWS